MNELGQVVGSAQGRAVVWAQARIRSLGAGEAVALNDQGQIVGWGPSDDGLGRTAFLWQNGTRQSLGTLPRGGHSDAVDVNERGQIVGTLSGPTGWNGPVLWQQGTMEAIRVSHPYLFQPLAINDRGQVALTDSGEWIFWQAGKVRYHGKGDARALNERGQVAISIDDGNERSPRIWENGKATRLPLLPGGEDGETLALNEHNQIVGSSCTFQSSDPKHSWYDCRYVLWTWRPT